MIEVTGLDEMRSRLTMLEGGIRTQWGVIAKNRRKGMSRKAVADGVRAAMGAFMK